MFNFRVLFPCEYPYVITAALKDRSNAGDFSLMPRKFFIVESPPNLSFNIFGARNSKTVAHFLVFLVLLNQSRLVKSRSPGTFKYLYNAASKSRFTFFLAVKLMLLVYWWN